MDNREFWVKLASSDSTTIKEVYHVCDTEDAIHPWAVSITVFYEGKVEATGHVFADSFEDGLVRLKKYADRQIAKSYSIVEKRSHLKPEVKPGR
jgi:hypothetical protein